MPYSNDDKTVAILRWNGTANIPEKISEEALVGISKETAENTSENATGKVVEESSGETPTE